jgi:uncharacterized phage-associated protein
MLYSPKSIANYFLDLAKASGQPISPMKLQKLVYYAHGWYVGYTGNPLIDEAVEAWQYGPVIPSLYHDFKRFGSGAIEGKAYEYKDGQMREAPVPSDISVRRFLENVWQSYGQFTGVRLSEMTHAPGGPWDQTWQTANNVKGIDIPFNVIASHFRAAAENAKKGAAA